MTASMIIMTTATVSSETAIAWRQGGLLGRWNAPWTEPIDLKITDTKTVSRGEALDAVEEWLTKHKRIRANGVIGRMRAGEHRGTLIVWEDGLALLLRERAASDADER